MNMDPNRQDLANREFEKIVPGLSDAIAKMRRVGFQQVTVVEALDFPMVSAYVPTGPSISNNYTSNAVGPAIPPLITPPVPGGSVTPGAPGEGGSPGGNDPGSGQETRYSCLENQCVPDSDGPYMDWGDCQENGCDTDELEDGYNNNAPGGGSGSTVSFMAKITGHTAVSGSSYRWKYAWSEVTLPGYGSGDGFITKVNGRFGTTTQDYALNMRESANIAPSTPTTGFGGPGYKIETDEAFKPIAVGTTVSGGSFDVVVLMHRVDNGRYVFESDNTIDGVCP